jgi:molybdate transport system substrate-binding protein
MRMFWVAPCRCAGDHLSARVRYRYAPPVRRPALALVPAFTLALACGRSSERETITVFAAASLTESFGAIEQAFEAEHPQYDVVLAFAGSQVLATQLLEGAQADVFASAHPEQVERVAEGRELIDRQAFASNRLVVVVRDDGAIRSLDQLAGEGVRVVLAGEAVPAGKYAREALTELGLRDSVMANVVSNEIDVRGVIGKLRAGEADAGIAYATDLRGSESVLEAIELPVDVHARYELAVLADANSRAGGQAFAAFVGGSEGQAILREFGFSSVDEP